MKKIRRFHFFSVGLLTLIAALLPTASVGAQTDACDDLIDLYGVDDPDSLIDAIEQAEAETGVDFHVFTIQTLAAGQDLNAASFANCPGASLRGVSRGQTLRYTFAPTVLGPTWIVGSDPRIHIALKFQRRDCGFGQDRAA